MDHFYEQLITTSKTGFYKTVNGAMFVFAFMGLASFSTNLILVVILLALAVACYFYKQKLFIEYEYQFTNGEIDIEKIIEMKKRSKVVTFNMKEVELIAPDGSAAVKDFYNKPNTIVKCYPTTAKAKVYVAMVTEGNNKMQLMFVPDEKFLDLCYKTNPRAVKKQ
ncbi:DUF6106 family protein [Clostridium sp. CF012]|uniref:DUF6106 family protein n=1 Tax=Clostridium sp. CF012 TaxID=2843319 RepID=UPI001C0DE84E|nr:DUF6106 family protein [Clostridium sp. CF012]MBU3145274.1 hypothetical protein [Clostridium sp. CF012]